MISIYCEKMDKVNSIYRYILTGYYVGFMANDVILPFCNKNNVLSDLTNEVKLIKITYDIVNTYRIYEPNKKYSITEYLDSVVNKISSYFINNITNSDIILLTNNIKMDKYELISIVVSMYFGVNRDRYKIPMQFMEILKNISYNNQFDSDFINELYNFDCEGTKNLPIETLSACIKCLCELFTSKLKNNLVNQNTVVNCVDNILYKVFNIYRFYEVDMGRLDSIANDVYKYIKHNDILVV